MLVGEGLLSELLALEIEDGLSRGGGVSSGGHVVRVTELTTARRPPLTLARCVVRPRPDYLAAVMRVNAGRPPVIGH